MSLKIHLGDNNDTIKRKYLQNSNKLITLIVRCLRGVNKIFFFRVTPAVFLNRTFPVLTQIFHVQSQNFPFFEAVLLTFPISPSHFFKSDPPTFFGSALPQVSPSHFLSQTFPFFLVSPSHFCKSVLLIFHHTDLPIFTGQSFPLF